MRGGLGLVTDELGHEFLCPSQLLMEFAEAEVHGTEGGASNRLIRRGFRDGCPGWGFWLGCIRTRWGSVEGPVTQTFFFKPVRKTCVALREPQTLPSSKLQACHVHWAVDGLGLSSSF